VISAALYFFVPLFEKYYIASSTPSFLPYTLLPVAWLIFLWFFELNPYS
jgi:hypothetical protein